MEIFECFKILKQHTIDHTAAHAETNGRCCLGPEAAALGAGALGAGVVMPPPEGGDELRCQQAGLGVVSQQALPQGQVLNIETGTNESLQGFESAEWLFDKFPDFRAPRRPGGELEVPETETAAAERLRSCGSSAFALVEAVLEQHKLRVAAHKSYDGAFRVVLARGVSAVALVYPLVVVAATSHFAAISAQVRAIAAVLAEHSGADERELGGSVRRLQALEKEKLAIVAAVHLDRVRFLAPRYGPDPGPGPASADAADLRRRMDQTDTEIEETVSELRHGLAELRIDMDDA